VKLPALQFYPGDWRKDPGVQALSRHDRSVWFDILLIMHESDERGVLLLAGKPMPEDALARMLYLDNQELKQILSTLLTYGVASKREEDGAIYSRRMVRDEQLLKVRRNAGKMGGNPVLLNQSAKQKTTTGVKQSPTPSSSSSFSSSDKEPPNPQGGIGRKSDNLPSSQNAIRISQLFSRRLTTKWSAKEIRAFKAIGPMDPEDLELVCRYTEAERAKGDAGKHRRDLLTFLNNFTGEIDRAREKSTTTPATPKTRQWVDEP